MKPSTFLRTFNRAAGFSLAAAWLTCQHLSAQTIPNPSFEADTFTTFPGYISNNVAITGWTGAPSSRIGLNPAGSSPFADNGTIPAGTKVAFIQANVDDPGNPSYLSAPVSGLTVGTTYKITFRANARTANTPNIKVYLDDSPVWLAMGTDGLATAAVGGSNPYWYVAFEFQATAASQVLKIVNDATGDQTLLVDDFQIAVSNGKWKVAAWTGDADTGVDATFLYTHAYNFNSSASADINGVSFTGVPGGAPAVAGRFSTTYLGNAYTGDFNLVGDNSAILAKDFVYGGNVPAGLYQSIAMQGLTPGTEYIVTLFSVGWENPAVGSRWATFSFGEDRITLNQDQFYNDNGISISYRYTADASGNATIKFAPLVPQNVSIHIYAFCNREAVSRFVAPAITAQPKSQIVSPDVAASFSVAAAGVPQPTYQWRFNGAPISGATTNFYSIAAVAATDAGNYDVVLSNRAGVVTSVVAHLTVGLPITNPSFEVDSFPVWPGYVSGNFPITGWDTLGGHGLNPVSDGRSPFGDNGAIPNGIQALFMQTDGNASQTISGFTVGAEYYVHYFENGRTETTIPGLAVQIGTNIIVPAHSVLPVRGGNDYYEMFSQVFTATDTSLTLAFVKSSPQGGDCTALVDDVALIRVPAGTAPFVGMQPKSTTVYVGQPATFAAVAQGSSPLRYQWRLNGTPIANATDASLTLASVRLSDEGAYTLVVTNSSGSVTSAVARLSLLESIPTLRNTGIDASGSTLAAGSVEPFWTFTINPDGGSSNVIVGNDGWPIAAGVWMVNNSVSKWVGPRAAIGAADIATGDYVYRTTFDLTGRDTNTVIINGRWASDNGGTAVFLNGATVPVPLSGSFAGWTSFTLTTNNATFLPGTNILDFGVNNAGAGPTGVRIEFTQTSARTLPGIPAAVAKQPVGGNLAEGDTFTLSVTGTGTLPLSYQWKKDGVDLPGMTSESLTLSNVTTGASGNYQCVVSNLWATALSSGALVDVIYRPLPNIYGTGVGTNGQLLADADIDPHYIMSVSPDPLFPGPNAIVVSNAYPVGAWINNGPYSRWIAPQANQNDGAGVGGGNDGGDYTFQTTVNLTGYDISRVQLLGAWAVDNGGTDILVNGQSTGLTCPGFGSLVPFTITNGLIAGINTLDFKLFNATNTAVTPNPIGLRVDLKAYLNIKVTVPKLQIVRNGTSVSISWAPVAAGQKLLWASDLKGPWTEVTGASNPHVTSATSKQIFYRVSQ